MTHETKQAVTSVLQNAAGTNRTIKDCTEDPVISKIAREVREFAAALGTGQTYSETCAVGARMVEFGEWP